jgi:hypothetical protein
MPMTDQKPVGIPGRQFKRRLSDTIFVAFHQACDQTDIEVAWELLNLLEFITTRHPNLPTGVERRVRESLVAAHERLWQIRHPTLIVR